MECGTHILKISARDLPKREFSAIDPVCFVELDSVVTGNFTAIGQTERVSNSVSPNFKTLIELVSTSHNFLKLEVFHTEKRETKNLLGHTTFSVIELLKERAVCKELELWDVKNGVVYVYLCSLEDMKEDITLKLTLSSRSHSLKLCREELDGSFAKIEMDLNKVKDRHKELWSKLPLIELGAGSLERRLQFRIQGELLEPSVKLRELLQAPCNEYTAFKRHTGEACVYCKVQYKVGNLNCTVAIDFTKSNGPIQQPISLHYLEEVVHNDYEKTLNILVDELQHHGLEGPVSMFGFGANVDGRSSHFFPLADRPVVQREAVAAYRRSVNQVQLGQQTLFAPLINHAIREAEKTHVFQLLVIITDGVAMDMYATKHAIVEACNHPVSVVLVGVGRREFDPLLELASEEDAVSVDGRTAERDIVHFVPVNDLEQWDGSTVMLLAELRSHMHGYLVARSTSQARTCSF